MKTAIKTVAYTLWFGLTIWLSVWFVDLMGSVYDENLPHKFLSHHEIAVDLVTWGGFVCFLACLPILLMKMCGSKIGKTTVPGVKFAIMFLPLLLGCTICCTWAWDNFIAGTLYNCTDPGIFDFLRPGDWVHTHNGVQIAVVPKINPDDDMSKPDTIKEGWNVPKLWLLWWSLVTASVVVSASFPLLVLRRRQSPDREGTVPLSKN